MYLFIAVFGTPEIAASDYGKPGFWFKGSECTRLLKIEAVRRVNQNGSTLGQAGSIAAARAARFGWAPVSACCAVFQVGDLRVSPAPVIGGRPWNVLYLGYLGTWPGSTGASGVVPCSLISTQRLPWAWIWLAMRHARPCSGLTSKAFSTCPSRVTVAKKYLSAQADPCRIITSSAGGPGSQDVIVDAGASKSPTRIRLRPMNTPSLILRPLSPILTTTRLATILCTNRDTIEQLEPCHNSG